ncbi:MAG: glutathione S-transferase family protein [Rhodospirillaceae bacterium]|jgi:glutathione S-transferase|nr:glutathione S-transferase family protein [Rhodospirillaceae bacterium]MBT4590234.1 glutathione S-transferase family protein [Rhodospirillaceae bacterium]MBT5939704.1 glutathione S-transferase family protein [Rhodospirillaceae bacterium]MBT7268734.1 glutathione S-transferase family protein [Rhodospirillaceae bacterium]
MLTLYHFWSSTCSRKVRITLAEKGIEWVSHHIDIVNKLENLDPDYVRLNPKGVVPTLDHDGKVIIESNIIIEYLDDTFPEIPLKPEDTYERAKMRLWMDVAEFQIHKNINVISYNKRHVPRVNKLFTKEEQRDLLKNFPDADKRAAMLERLENGVSEDQEAFAEQRLCEAMDKIEETLGESVWLAGDQFSLADIAVAPFIERFEANGLDTLVDWSKRPKAGDWWQRVQARPSYQTAYAFENPNA